MNKKMQEVRLLWLSHVMRIKGAAKDLKEKALNMEIDEKKRKDRPIMRWKNCGMVDARNLNFGLGIMEENHPK